MKLKYAQTAAANEPTTAAMWAAMSQKSFQSINTVVLSVTTPFYQWPTKPCCGWELGLAEACLTRKRQASDDLTPEAHAFSATVVQPRADSILTKPVFVSWILNTQIKSRKHNTKYLSWRQEAPRNEIIDRYNGCNHRRQSDFRLVVKSVQITGSLFTVESQL